MDEYKAKREQSYLAVGIVALAISGVFTLAAVVIVGGFYYILG